MTNHAMFSLYIMTGLLALVISVSLLNEYLNDHGTGR